MKNPKEILRGNKDPLAGKTLFGEENAEVSDQVRGDVWEDEGRKELVLLIFCGAALIASLFMADGLVKTVFAFVIWLYAGFEVFKGAWEGIREGEIFSEELLMTLSSLGAVLIGEVPEAAAVMLFYRVGEYFADKAVDKSRDDVAALAALMPDTVRVIRGGIEETVPAEEVSAGEIYRVLPGERIPLDGEILSGEADIDLSALTGESLPARKSAGEEIFSGTVNLTGDLTVRALCEAKDSAASRIVAMAGEAADRKAEAEDFTARFAKFYTPCVVIAAALILLIPSFITGDWRLWIHRALSFLMVSCPCALVVSVPLAFFCGVGCASRHGILVKGPKFLERLAKADICVFDKTGTLTTGGMEVRAVHPAGVTEEELLSLAAGAEAFSNHPIAGAVKRAAQGREGKLLTEKPGRGIIAEIGGTTVLAGTRRLLSEEGVSVPGDAAGSVFVARDGAFIGSIEVGDDVKSTAKKAVELLKALGVKKTVMLSGDTEPSARAVARQVGIDEVHASLLPRDKAEKMKEIAMSGKTLYTGDGVNDAPVLAESFVGAAMGGLGSDAAIEAADVVIMDDELTRLPTAIRIGRRTYRIAVTNIIVSLAVKFILMAVNCVTVLPLYISVLGDVGVLILASLNALRALHIKEDSHGI